MAWDGHLVQGDKKIQCKNCGKDLNSDGNHPAETYAGTYNGLCYACTGAGAFLTGRVHLSGAAEYSHPPHCPSWRRDREMFYGFEGCSKCRGKGAVWVSRADGQGGSYTIQCEKCSKLHHEHPDQKAAEEAYRAYTKARTEWMYASNVIWVKELRERARKARKPLPRGKDQVAKAIKERREELDPGDKLAKKIIAESEKNRPEEPEIEWYKE